MRVRRTNMKIAILCAGICLTALAGGCGGANSASDTTFAYVMPALNSQRLYSRVIIDNSGNTINQTISDTVTAVNADGSYEVLVEDPNHDSVRVNGTTYSIVTESVSVNDSDQDTAYSYAAPDGSTVTCTYVPHGGGPDLPLTVGTTWTLTYTFSCGANAPVSYTQTGTVVDVESVTVPAGTFSAIKLQSTLTWTGPEGVTRTQTIANFRDVNTLLSVKEDISTAYSGTKLVNGYPVSTETVLQSAT